VQHLGKSLNSDDSAAWQLVQLQLVPLAQEQAEAHPASREEISNSLQNP